MIQQKPDLHFMYLQIQELKPSLKTPLTRNDGDGGHGSGGTESIVHISAINRVFQWDVGKRLTLLKAIMECQTDLPSRTTSDGKNGLCALFI